MPINVVIGINGAKVIANSKWEKATADELARCVFQLERLKFKLISLPLKKKNDKKKK